MTHGLETLRERAAAGVVERWPRGSREVLERIDFELAQFEACGRIDYCLMALGVCDAIRAAGGLIGSGRGGWWDGR